MKSLKIALSLVVISLSGCAQSPLQQQQPKASISAFAPTPFTPSLYSSPSENFQKALKNAASNCELMQSSGRTMWGMGLEEAANAYRQNLVSCQDWALRNGSTAFSETQKAKRSVALEQADKILYVKFTSYIGALTIYQEPDLATKNAYKEAESLQRIEEKTIKK